MLKLKSCTHCEGDMHRNRDVYGPYDECLQCGHMVNYDPDSRLLTLLAKAEKAQKKVA